MGKAYICVYNSETKTLRRRYLLARDNFLRNKSSCLSFSSYTSRRAKEQEKTKREKKRWSKFVFSVREPARFGNRWISRHLEKKIDRTLVFADWSFPTGAAYR